MATRSDKLNNDGNITQLGDAPQGPGVDGIYRNHTPPPEFYAVDAKYDKAQLGTLADGTKQMSDDWLTDPNRIEKALPDAQQRQAFLDAIENGEVQKLVGKVNPDGTITYYNIDAAGNVGSVHNF